MPDDEKELEPDFPEEDDEPVDPDEMYQALKTVTPPRNGEEDDDYDEGVSLETAERDNPNESDLKATLRQLFPRFEDKKIDQLARVTMVARIQPDVFKPMLRLTVDSIVRNHLDDDDVTVASVLVIIYSIISIGLEGKGRIDGLELAGSAKDAEELDRISKGLGIA